MLIMRCDYNPGLQQIALVDTRSGELRERRLAHREQAEQFRWELKQRNLTVHVGMESSGHSRFGRLLHELRFELWIEIPGEIRTKRCVTKTTDRRRHYLAWIKPRWNPARSAPRPTPRLTPGAGRQGNIFSFRSKSKNVLDVFSPKTFSQA